MAFKAVRIGSLEDAFIYDDEDYSTGIEIDAPIKVGAPITDDDVLRKGDVLNIAPGSLIPFKLLKANVDGDVVSVTELTSDRMVKIDASGNPASVTNLTTGKLTSASNAGSLSSVENLQSFIAGTGSEIDVVDDLDGTITLKGGGSNTNFTFLSTIQAGGVGVLGIQYQTQTITLSNGIISNVSPQSSLVDI